MHIWMSPYHQWNIVHQILHVNILPSSHTLRLLPYTGPNATCFHVCISDFTCPMLVLPYPLKYFPLLSLFTSEEKTQEHFGNALFCNNFLLCVYMNTCVCKHY